MAPRLPSWPAPLQVLALVVSPRLELRHKEFNEFESSFEQEELNKD